MRVPERQAFFDQVVGQVSGRGVATQGGALHGLGLDGNAALLLPGGGVELTTHHFRKNAQRVFKGVHGVKQRFLVFLVVFVVSQRLALHEGDQPHQVAHHAAGFAPGEFGHVGVLLLRHDRTAGGESVRNLDETKVLAHPQNQFFAEAADVHHAQTGRSGEFNSKLAVAHGVQRVLANLRLALGINHA